MRSITKILLLIIFIPVAALADANPRQPEVSGQEIGNVSPTMLNQRQPEVTPHNYNQKSPGQYTPEDWAAAIDSVWGPGLPWSVHLAIWNLFWTNMNEKFAAFPGLDANIWQDVFDRYNQEVLDTVSKGRFSAILSHASLALRELHNFTYDNTVSTHQLVPGVPLMKVGTWVDNSHFGAGLTVTLDSALLVYKAFDPHPLGLVPGDIVLGYDGIAWKDIYPQLLAAELPFANLGVDAFSDGNWGGSTDIAYEYTFLVSAGRNWHLFDTMDVIKFDTGDTVHLATDAMVGQNMPLYGTEQMDIPGIPIPDFVANERLSWGIVGGTNIGYIYINSIRAEDVTITRNTWLNALDSLQNFYDVDGLILDFRMFLGATGQIEAVFNYLLDTTMVVLRYDERCTGGGHFDHCLRASSNSFTTVNGNNGEYWDRPLAVLTGPGAKSGGDVFPMVISLHPLAKVFGRSSAGAFSSVTLPFLASGWTHWITGTIASFTDDPGNYLVRAEFPGPRFPWVEFEEVWLTPSGVAQGRDDVVEAAISWIQSCDIDGDGILCKFDNCPLDPNPDQLDNDNDGIGNACCCVGSTGNADGDPADVVDIADLTFLIDHLFINFPLLACPLEGNVDGDPAGIVDIADLTFLIDHLFINFPPTAACQ